MPLRPKTGSTEPRYPKMGRKLLGGLFMAATMSATTLGGCGPAIDSRSLDATLDSGDLDAAADCDGDATDAECEQNGQ